MVGTGRGTGLCGPNKEHGQGSGAAQERKAEVAKLQANRDALVKAGMIAKLEWCEPKARPCIRVIQGRAAREAWLVWTGQHRANPTIRAWGKKSLLSRGEP